MADFRIATLNINGGRDIVKRANLFGLMSAKNVDIMFVQETHIDTVIENNWRTEWAGHLVLSHMSNLSAGVGIIFSKSFCPLSYESKEVIEGRLLVVKAIYETFTFFLINVYAPTGGLERQHFFTTLSEVLKGCETDGYVFLGGDFNCTIDDNLDRNHREPHKASQDVLRRALAMGGLVDVWRRLNGDVRQYSWSHCRENRLIMARLDRFYCLEHHFNIFKKCRMTPVGFSDHFFVCCDVFIANIKPKSAYWHFNSALVSDKHFREIFVYFWNDFRNDKHSFGTLKKWWDHGKAQIRDLCQHYSRNVTNNMAKSMEQLEEEIMELQGLCINGGGGSELHVLADRKSCLKNLLGLKAQGALVRSRYKFANEMDTPSKFFFDLEKKNGQKRFFHTCFSEDGNELIDSNEIRERAVNF